MEHDRLRAADSERGNQDRPAATHGSHDHISQSAFRIARIVFPVSVRRFDEKIIRLLHRGRIEHSRAARAANIAGKHDLRSARNEFDDGRSQNVSSWHEAKLDAGTYRSLFVEVDGFEAFKRGFRILLRIQRECRTMLREAVPVGKFRVLFLQVTAVRQQDRRESHRVRCGVHLGAQPVAHERWQVAGVVAVADTIKEDSVEAIRVMQAMGLEVVMLTGDNERTARAIARQVGIDQVLAEVLPEDKVEQVHLLKKGGRKVGMVGDGINDAPALVEAHVGFAIGTGTDVAIEAADITLMSGSLKGVAYAIEISRATMRNAKQSLFGAFVYNTLGVPVAAGLLFPVFGLLLSPIIAGAAMAASSVTVVSNANRLRFFEAKSFAS